ncbi:MAG: alpha/beta hydrolase [Dietzia sp.]
MTSQITPLDLDFRSGGDTCRGWFLPAAGTAPAPCVVMVHGLGGTADSGLLPFAEAFAAAGYAAFAFDYRGFGRSGGGPRQVVSPSRQQDDFRAAVAAVSERPDVDADRIVLWGCSLGGGHALEVARDPGGSSTIAGVIAVVPLLDGRAAAVAAARQHQPSTLLRSAGTTVAAKAAAALGRTEPMVPLVGPPGSNAVLSLEGYEEAYNSVAGPTWRNEIGGGVGAVLGSFRPGAKAGDLAGLPVLMQIADLDRSAPPHSAGNAAFAARAEVRHYPGDHFDLFPGRQCHELAVTHALHFLRRHVG